MQANHWRPNRQMPTKSRVCCARDTPGWRTPETPRYRWTAASTFPTTPPTPSAWPRCADRYIVFQALPHTLGLGPEVWRVLAKAHELRNLAEYEGHVDVEERLVRDVVAVCETVAERIEATPGDH